MKKYQLLILKKYFKSFLTIFIALTIFFTGVDIVSNISKLPDAANMKILYSINTMLYFSSYILGLCIVFAMISTVVHFIKESELVVLYALGTSKKALLKPFIMLALIFISIFILLQNFSFYVSAQQISSNIKHYGKSSQLNENLFLKSGSSYIYISKLDKLKKEGTDIKIYEVDGGDLIRVVRAKKGVFIDNYWLLEDAEVTLKPRLNEGSEEKVLKVFTKKKMEVLAGFKPEIMDSLYDNAHQLTIMDSIKALTLLADKDISLIGIKASLYKSIIYPFFALFLMIILFFRLPIQRRGENIAMLSGGLYFIALIVWGILFLFIRISQNGSVTPEVGIILPTFLLGIYAIFTYKKNTKSF
ncbi:MAG TPA: YjgP/YjgQ family permease [Campylobacterales bacterium]|nr:YjgP/YjgQ family permease [Campylobacterales bacterium]